MNGLEATAAAVGRSCSNALTFNFVVIKIQTHFSLLIIDKDKVGLRLLAAAILVVCVADFLFPRGVHLNLTGLHHPSLM